MRRSKLKLNSAVRQVVDQVEGFNDAAARASRS